MTGTFVPVGPTGPASEPASGSATEQASDPPTGSIPRISDTGEAPRDRLLRSSAVMAAGTLVSRVLGMARASLLTALLGVNGALAYDAFSVANTVPNQIYNLVAGGLLNAVLVPQITRAARDRDGGQEYLNRLLTLALAGMAAVTALVIAAAPLVPTILSRFAPGSATARLCVAFAFWCLPQVFCYGVYTMLGQVLNARSRFGAYMWAPVVNNVIGIAGIAVMLAWIGPFRSDPHPPETWTSAQISVLAGTATLGVAAQALVLIWPLHRAGVRFRPNWGWRGVGLGTAGRVAAWTFAAALVGQIGVIETSRAVTGATQAGGAGRGAYDNALLLFMLPHSLVTVSLVTALFTPISEAAGAGDIGRVRRMASRGLRLTGVATVLATAGAVVLAPDVATTLFPGNGPRDTEAIAAAMSAMILGLAPFSAQYLFQRVFYAFEDARTPFLIQLPTVTVITMGAFLSAHLLPPAWIVTGVGLATSTAYLTGASISALVLRHRLHGIEGRAVVQVYVRLVVAAVPAALVALTVQWAAHRLVGPGFTAGVLSLAMSAAALVATYLAVARRMRVGEVADLLAALPGPARRLLGSAVRPPAGQRLVRPAAAAETAARVRGRRAERRPPKETGGRHAYRRAHGPARHSRD